MSFLETRSSCTQRCKSAQHAYDLISFLTKTSDTHLLLSGIQQCWNCGKIQDSYGRSLIHMAACCGRAEVIEWLINYKKVELNVKTLENGWTSLHCAAFYGQIASLVLLIKNGANVTVHDNDKLTFIEHLALDKKSCYRGDDIQTLNDYDCYTWGSNINFTLGHSNELERAHAELIEYFKKFNVAIVQIAMSKFHTLFRDSNGSVYSCGHGKDGRLGHNNEETYMLPTLISSLKNEKCVWVAASTYNSYFVLIDGSVKSCGANEFRQLGQPGESKSLIPKTCTIKALKDARIVQVHCGRFHCALLSSDNNVYTFGLNGGQLGHARELQITSSNVYVKEARLVKELARLDLKFELIACSDGATVCLDQKSKRIVYLLNDYKLKRLPMTLDTIRKIRVHGGKLDYQANSEVLGPDLGDPIVIVCLTTANTLIIWRESKEDEWRQVHWNLNKKLKINDFDLNKQGLIFSTVEGLCFTADFNKFKVIKQSISSTQQQHQRTRQASSNDLSFNDSLSNDVIVRVELLDLVQIQLVNRCAFVFSDPKGRNHAALQYYPYLNMRNYPQQEPSTLKNELNVFYMDNFQSSSCSDIVMSYKNKKFHLNKFILSSRCSKFYAKHNLSAVHDFNLGEVLENKFDVKSLEMMFSYIYSGQYKSLSELFKFNNLQNFNQMSKYFQQFKELCDKFSMSELKKQVIEELLKKLTQNDSVKNDVKLRDFVENSMSMLHARLKFAFVRDLSVNELYDCVIKCNKNEFIQCHKCVLMARSDYFNNMFQGYWLESNISQIELPFDYDLLRIIIDYLYTDDISIDFSRENIETNKAKTEKEIEILFNLYILSDQLLLFRIKNLCEFKLTNLINLKNCIDIYQFSSNYEARQLNEFCLEFIVNNLITLIESKYIECLDLHQLNEITRFYCKYFDCIDSRRITPYSDGLDCTSVELVPLELLYDQKFVDEEESSLLKRRPIVTTPTSPTISSVESERLVKEERNKNSEGTTADLKVVAAADMEENMKWEKVKKKKKKNANDKENDSTASVKKIVVGALFSEKDVKEFEETKNKELLQQQQQKQAMQANRTGLKPEQRLNSVSYDAPNKASPPINASKSVPWVSTPAIVAKSPTPTLFDIINEEMTKHSVVKEKPKAKPAGEAVINSPPKGWNMSNTIQTASKTAPAKTMSQIIAMEEQYTKQYQKYTNRNMDLIQLEEKAIEDLKRLYSAFDSSDMRITVELIQDTDLNVLKTCAPKWKK